MLRRIMMLVLFPALVANAQSDLNSRSLSGVQSMSIPQRNWLVHFEGRYPTILKIYDQSKNKMIDLPEQMVRTEAGLYGNVFYGLFHSTTLFAAAPFRWLNYYSPDLVQKNRGLGDFSLGIFQQLIQKQHGLNLNSELAVIFPTGAHKNLSSAELPLGDGCFAARFGFNGNYASKSHSIIYSLNYLYRGGNSNKIDLGDKISFLGSFQKELNTSFGNFLYELGASSDYYFKNSSKGISIENSDEFSTSLFAGFGYFYSKNIRFAALLPITVYKRAGWMTDYSVSLQVDYLFESHKINGGLK